MDEPIYPYKKSFDILTFEFESEGPNGKSKKKIVYSSLENTGDIYSLSLFEVLEDGTLDVYFESKNKDLKKIMATVLRTLMDFFNRYPNKKVAFTGSTPQRLRLYRVVISKLLEEINIFKVEGILEDRSIVSYMPNTHYVAYIVSLN
jgi:isocitrate dehydrogenase kinase/phosphatase